jgi:1-acyl-sn-glycerol-3-phosphate acyltransferase
MPELVFQKSWLPDSAVEMVRAVVRGLFFTLARVEVRGFENLPVSGGFIVSNNHLSRLDTPLLYSLLRRRKITAFVADTYRSNVLFAPVINMLDVIWVHRGAIGPSTLKYAIKALRQGSIVGVAPEGTRSHTGGLGEGKSGAAFLAAAAGVPIVPVAVDNPERILPAILRLRRQLVTVTVGQPLTAPVTPGGRPDTQILEHFTTEVMCQLAALLPPERRGLYAEHPRVAEILAAKKAGR